MASRPHVNSAPAWQRMFLYLTLTGLGASGVLWMGVHYATQGASADESSTYALLHRLMVFHGILGYGMAVAVGLFLAQHVGAGWRARRSLRSGISLLVLFAALMASALILYYTGDDSLRAWASLAHQIVGVGLVLTLPIHVLQHLRKASRPPLTARNPRAPIDASRPANSPAS